MSDKLDLHSPGAIEVTSAMFHDVQVAIIHINNTAYMMGIDVGRALGYERARNVHKHYGALADADKLEIKGELLRTIKSRVSDSVTREIRANINHLQPFTARDEMSMDQMPWTPFPSIFVEG